MKNHKREKELKGKYEATLRYAKTSISKLTEEYNDKIAQVDNQIDKVKGAQMLKVQQVR